MSDLDAKLAEVARQYDEVQAELGTPEVLADPDRAPPARPGAVPPRAGRRGLPAARGDPRPSWPAPARCATRPTATTSCKAMAREEIDRLEADETRLVEELKVLLLPRDPNDDRNVILEIRGRRRRRGGRPVRRGALRMYLRYAERHRFSPEVLSLNETGIGGIKEAIVEVAGDGAYSRLKFEGGVHRVQRVPATESSGRIHTSTATVIVMPEADEVEIAIDEERDLRIDVKRSSGPGGQSVNTTDSAVRDHPPADRAGGRDPGREEPAQEQGQGDGGPALAAVRPRAAEAARGGLGGAAVDGRVGRPLGQDPDLQLPAGPGHRSPDRHDRPQPAGRAGGRPRRPDRRAGDGRPGRPPRRR